MVHDTRIKSGSAETATGALSVTGPQPVWMTLDEARERAFTGEIAFEVDPEVLAYLDHGVVYYAERTSDASLGRRLLESGVLDTSQLERGIVRVGDIEHLGRLFDRDSSVDRDAVLVVTETSTQELIAELANQAVTTVRVTAYRHHPSGVHRWFVTRLDAQSVTQPATTLEHPVYEVLGGLSLVSDVMDGELTIEWDELTDSMRADESDSLDLLMFDPFGAVVRDGAIEDTNDVGDAAGEFDADVIELSLDMATFVDDDLEIFIDDAFGNFGEDDLGIVDEDDLGTFVDDDSVVAVEVDDDLVLEVVEVDDDSVVVAVEVDDDLMLEVVEVDDDSVVEVVEVDDDSVVEVVEVDDDLSEYDFQVMWPNGTEDSVLADTVELEVVDVPAFTQTDDGELRFEMPELELGADDEVTDEVPEDVAAAVRRAIAAIESASVEAPTIAPIESPDVDEVLDGVEVTSQFGVVEPAPESFAGFAPPTIAMSAEVMYAQLAEQPDDVFVDDEPIADLDEGSGNERSSALRRLIGSLRRREH